MVSRILSINSRSTGTRTFDDSIMDDCSPHLSCLFDAAVGLLIDMGPYLYSEVTFPWQLDLSNENGSPEMYKTKNDVIIDN